ncbi:MAG: RNA polymerase sigma factor [Verrucomicrobiota bacterium]
MMATAQLGDDLAAFVQQSTVANDAVATKSPASLSVRSLTQGMVAGNEAAYRSFHEAYFQRLLRYLLVLARGDEDAARETLQVTLERVVRYIKLFEAEAQFWSWLTVLARSAFADRYRKRRRYLIFLDRFKTHTEAVAAPGENGAADARLLTELDALVASLSGEERELVERKYFGGESVRDIAATLQASEKAVESRLGRVRRKLKELLLEKLKHETTD